MVSPGTTAVLAETHIYGRQAMGGCCEMGLRDALYRALKYSNDMRAVRRGQIVPRLERRAYGRFSTRLRNKLIPPRGRRRRR